MKPCRIRCISAIVGKLRLGVIALASTIWCASILTGCAGPGPQKSPEEVVRARAEAHLGHLSRGEWELALDYTTPAFRSAYNANQYGARYAGAAKWLSARIGDVVCHIGESPVCEVETFVETKRPQFDYSNERFRPRKWFKVDDGWYIFEPPR